VAEDSVGSSYGKRLLLARREKGFGQDELAEKVGVHPKTISRWENDRQQPNGAQEDRLLEVLEITRDWLRGRTNSGVRETPHVAYGLPQTIRVWIQEFLTKLVRAGVSDREVDEARRVLTSPEMYRAYVGSEPQQYSEDETLLGIQAHGVAIETVLRSRGYEIPK
jgi:transcriptional regulator with XRE-family HTH domain